MLTQLSKTQKRIGRLQACQACIELHAMEGKLSLGLRLAPRHKCTRSARTAFSFASANELQRGVANKESQAIA